MNKYFIILLIAVSLSVSFGFASKSAARANQFAFVDPIVKPTPLAEIERIELDKKEITIACEPNIFKDDSRFCGYKENGLVSVKTVVNKGKDIPLIYQYKVSGGRIIGQGEKVVWDLKGIRPGTYTITAAIDYGRGFSAETKPQEVSVVECCCIICVCPNIYITSNDSVKAGETVIFKVEVSAGTQTIFTYNWTVSQGEIIAGQGTSEIKVKTSREMTGSVTATVEIGGDFCDTCMRTDSETATIIK